MSALGVSEQDIIIVGERVSNIETVSDDDSISSDVLEYMSEETSNSDIEEIAVKHPHFAPKKYVFDPKDDEEDEEDDDYQVGNDSEAEEEEEEEDDDASDIEEIALPSNHILVRKYEFGPHEQDDDEDDEDYCLDEEK